MVNSVMSVEPSETISISEFKAKCLAVLERVRATGVPVVVTRRGLPIAEVSPPSPARGAVSWLGAMRQTARITGDLLAPASAPEEWEVLGE